MRTRQLRLRRSHDGAVLCQRLVVGASFWQRFVGLMGRPSLDEGEGLWLQTSSIHMLFMRFPIDALFVSKASGDGRRSVVSMRQELPPWRGIVLPVRGADGVVEMPAGTLSRLGVAVGDEVVFEDAHPSGEPAHKGARRDG